MPETIVIGVIAFWEKIKLISKQMPMSFQWTEGLELLEYLNDEVKNQH